MRGLQGPCASDVSSDVGADPLVALAAQSWSATDVAEIPVREQEQVPARRAHRTPV